MYVLKLPHPDSLEYRRSTRILEEEQIDWVTSTQYIRSFCNPTKTLLNIYEEGKWKVDRWLIEGLIRLGETNLAVGGSNVGKTYLLGGDLVFSVLTGEKFLGRYPTDVGSVWYLGGEGDENMLVRRMVNVCLARNYDPTLFFRKYWPRLFFMMPENYTYLYGSPYSSRDFRTQYIERILSTPINARPKLLIGDPLTGLVKDADSDPEEVQSVINWQRKAAQLSDAAFMTLHHPKKTQANGPTDRKNLIRGESSWLNFVDNVFYLEAEEDDNNLILWYTEKSRDSSAANSGGPTLAIKRNFEEPTNLPQDLQNIAPGVLWKASHICVSAPEPKKKGKNKKEKVEDAPAQVVTQQLLISANEVHRVLLKAQKTLSRIELRDALPTMNEITFQDALSQLVKDNRILAESNGRTAYYTSTV
jgi:hypothetical protein